MTRGPVYLRLLIYATVGAGIGVYTLAEGDALFAALAFAVWAMAWPVSLAQRGSPLPRPILTLALVGALAYAVLRAAADTQDLVTAVSRLLVALQLVKLYDRWGRNDRGLILATSAFLAVGAVLTSNSLAVGASMLGYLPILMWATLQHGLARVEEAAGERPRTRRRRAESRDLRRLTFVAGAAALGLAVATFLIVPRGVGEGFLGGINAGPTLGARSGFNDSVTLGDAGLITESREPVMDVVLRNGEGRNIGSSGRPLHLRGAVLTRYEDGRWTKGEGGATLDAALAPGAALQLSNPAPRAETFTLDVTLRGGRGTHLFAPLRPISITSDSRIGIRVERETLELQTRLTGPTSYSVRFQDTDAVAAGGRTPASVDGAASDRVRQLAESLLEDAGVPADPAQRDADADASAVGALVNRLHREYFYTTQMTAAEAGEDPIEMFLFRTKEGHCEYFASALTAMCRSVGLPARVVTGYLAVEFDDTAGAYLVRESNAHAWVEVRLSDGRWVTVDPSPPDDLAVVHQPPTGVVASVNRWFDKISRWWIVNVVAFDEGKRQALVGRDPLLIESTLRSAAEDALLPARTGGAPILLIALLRGVVVFAGAAALGFAVLHVWTALGGVLRSRRAARRADGDDPAAAERRAQRVFYARVLRALRRAGFAKPPGRPILDHAKNLSRADGVLGGALDEIGRLYYASRFGRHTLSPAQLERAQALAGLIAQRARAAGAGRRRTTVR